MTGPVAPSSLATVAPANSAGTPLAAPLSTGHRVLHARRVQSLSSGPLDK